MTKSARSQGFIAVFAAYVVALQALLLPLSVLAGAPGSNSLPERCFQRRRATDGPPEWLPLRRRLRPAMLRTD